MACIVGRKLNIEMRDRRPRTRIYQRLSLLKYMREDGVMAKTARRIRNVIQDGKDLKKTVEMSME